MRFGHLVCPLRVKKPTSHGSRTIEEVVLDECNGNELMPWLINP